MSIVALKRKSAALKNQSTGRDGFSINGTTRNQGYIGQTLQSRHLIHKGMMAKRVLREGITCNVVKPDSNHIGTHQGAYIDRLKRKNLKQIEDFCPEPEDPQPVKEDACKLLRTLKGARIFSKPKTVCNIAKKVGADTHAEYMAALNKSCTADDVSYIITTNILRTPYF